EVIVYPEKASCNRPSLVSASRAYTLTQSQVDIVCIGVHNPVTLNSKVFVQGFFIIKTGKEAKIMGFIDRLQVIGVEVRGKVVGGPSTFLYVVGVGAGIADHSFVTA